MQLEILYLGKTRKKKKKNKQNNPYNHRKKKKKMDEPGLREAGIYVDKYPYTGAPDRHFFITHWHKDHTRGLTLDLLQSPYVSWYCTPPTAVFLRYSYPGLDLVRFTLLDVSSGPSASVQIGPYLVTAYDSNHMEGSMMLLFRSPAETIFYTGDYRYTPGMALPEGLAIDRLYYDALFARFPGRMLTLEQSAERAQGWIKRCLHTNHTVYVSFAHLGTCQLLAYLHRRYGTTFRLRRRFMFGQPLEVLRDVYPGCFTASSRVVLVHVKNPEQPYPRLIPSCLWHAIEGTNYHEFVGVTGCLRAPGQGAVCRVNFTNHSDPEDNRQLLERLSPTRALPLFTNHLSGKRPRFKGPPGGPPLIDDDPSLLENPPSLEIAPKTETKYFSRDGFSTKIWGPMLWTVLHIISLGYPVSPTLQEKRAFEGFVLAIGRVLPCGACRANFEKNLQSIPPLTSGLVNRDTFSRWMYDLHTCVNTQLGKPTTVTFEEVRDQYEAFRFRVRKSHRGGCHLTSGPRVILAVVSGADFSLDPSLYIDPSCGEQALVKDYNSTQGFPTTVWGPMLWSVMYMVALNFPVEPSAEDRGRYSRFFGSVGAVLPCEECRNEFMKVVRSLDPVEKYLDSRENVARWVYRLDTKINGGLESFEKLRDQYEVFRARCGTAKDGVEAGCTKSVHSQRPRTIVVFAAKDRFGVVPNLYVDPVCAPGGRQ